MKKLFPDAVDVAPSVANRASRIIEKHLRIHHVSRAKDLPEDARIRLYRDLRFFFDSGSQPPGDGSGKFSIRGSLADLWSKIENFLSAFNVVDTSEMGVIAWIALGEPAKLIVAPWYSDMCHTGEGC